MDQNNISSYQDNARLVSSCLVGSFAEKLRDVRKRVEVECFRRDRRQAEELCMIIAEVESLPDHYEIQIAGEKVSMAFVKEIYTRLTHAHIKFVIIKFREQKIITKYKKSYLRTMLYNSVFELESHWINEVHVGE